MDRKLGLNGYFQLVKGAGLGYKIKELGWQLRYAWQRAWRGYDSVDVFDLWYAFANKMPVLLKEFKKRNIGLFYDEELNRYLDEDETNQVLDELIFYFENCDDGVVYDRLLGEDWSLRWKQISHEEFTNAKDELARCQKEAIRLFSKWCWNLWY